MNTIELITYIAELLEIIVCFGCTCSGSAKRIIESTGRTWMKTFDYGVPSFLQEDINNPGTILAIQATALITFHLNSTKVEVLNWGYEGSLSRPSSFVQFPEYILIADQQLKCVKLYDRSSKTLSNYSGFCSKSYADAADRDGDLATARYVGPQDLLVSKTNTSHLYMVDIDLQGSLGLKDHFRHPFQGGSIKRIDMAAKTVTTILEAKKTPLLTFNRIVVIDNDGFLVSGRGGVLQFDSVFNSTFLYALRTDQKGRFLNTTFEFSQMTRILPGVFLTRHTVGMGFPNKFFTVDTTTTELTGMRYWKTLQPLKLTNGDYMTRINDTLIVTKFPYSPLRRWSWGKNFTLYTWNINGKPTDTGHCSLQKMGIFLQPI